MQKTYYLQLLNKLSSQVSAFKRKTFLYLEEHIKENQKALDYAAKVVKDLENKLDKYIDINCRKANSILCESIKPIIDVLDLKDAPCINYCEDYEFKSVPDLENLISDYTKQYNELLDELLKIAPEISEVKIKDNKDNFSYEFYGKKFEGNYDTPITLDKDSFLNKEFKDKIQELLNLYTTISNLQAMLEANASMYFKIDKIKNKINHETKKYNEELTKIQNEKTDIIAKILFNDGFIDELNLSLDKFIYYNSPFENEFPYSKSMTLGTFNIPLLDKEDAKIIESYMPKFYSKLKAGNLVCPFYFNLNEFDTISMDSSIFDTYKIRFIDVLITSILRIYPRKKVHIHFIDLDDTLKLSKFMSLKKLGVDVDIFRNSNEVDSRFQELINIRFAQEDALMSLGYDSCFTYNKIHEDDPFDIHLNILVNFPFCNNKLMNAKIADLLNSNEYGIYNFIIFNKRNFLNISNNQQTFNILDFFKNETYFLSDGNGPYLIYFDKENKVNLFLNDEYMIKDLLKEADE